MFFRFRAKLSRFGPISKNLGKAWSMSDWSLTPPGEVHEVDTRGRDYARFRTGETFATVRAALDQEARHLFHTTGERMFITRRTVLGRMHQIKQTQFRTRTKRWDMEAEHMPDVEGVEFDPGEDFF